MSKIGYIFKCVATMDYKSMLNTVGDIHKKSGKNRVKLFCDMIYCGFRYGCGYKDYSLNEWYNLNKQQRTTYITRGINNSIVARYNDPAFMHILDNKIEFNEYFSDLLGRKWLDMKKTSKDEFIGFMSDIDAIIVKPIDLSCGAGVEKLKKADFPDIGKMYDHIMQSGSTLVEEYIVQHSEMSRLYPYSVNTLRIVSVISDDGEPHILYSFIRMGNGGRVVDNINAGGMAAPIDLDKGIISNIAFDKDYNYYDKHPLTGTALIGFSIPYWNEAVNIVLTAAKRIPQVRYVGWDVAITDSGAVFVEGNQHPGHDFLQMPPHVPDKIGILPRFREFIDV